MEVGTSRQFSGMDFRLFYSSVASSTASYGGNIPALTAPPAITKVRATSNAGTVTFQISVLGDPAAGIQEVWVIYTICDESNVCNGIWQPIDLTQNPLDSTLWEGTLNLGGTPPDHVRYMVQAVNGVGLVALAANLGEYYVPDIDPGQLSAGGDPASPPAPTALALQSPPTSGNYNATVEFDAVLTSEGSPLADQLVTFALGSQQRQATTDGSGLARVEIPLLGVAGPGEVRASFAGNINYLPSDDTSEFTINKQGTQLTLPPEITAPEGTDTGLIATLADADGNPMREKAVFVTVSGGGGFYATFDITNLLSQASLGVVPLPPGTYNVTAYFSGLITLPGQTIELSDRNYESSTAQATLIIETAPSPGDHEYYLPLIFKQ
jgi:hypothetical protein